MRRRDYKILARALRASKPGKSQPQELAMWAFVVTHITQAFLEEFEAAFDKARFLRMIEEA